MVAEGRWMPTLLDRELDTYERNRESLLATAEGKFVLIHDDSVLGVFESEADAVDQGYQRLGYVPFLVKQVQRVEVPLTFVSGILGI